MGWISQMDTRLGFGLVSLSVDGTKALVDGTLPSRHPPLRTGSRPPPLTARTSPCQGDFPPGRRRGSVGWSRLSCDILHAPDDPAKNEGAAANIDHCDSIIYLDA